MRKIIWLLVFVLGISYAYSQEPLHMTLLAVQEENGTLTGSTADVYLELQQGNGRVFLETQPLTKIDTQISTRFAKEIACNYFDIRCSDTDFIYTIKSDSNIIGGPSAGAALSALTAMGVMGISYNEDIAVTGTINSGGLIGPVGGLKQKIEAAAKANIKTVLIPFGTAGLNESLIAHGKSLGVNVVEVKDLNEVVKYFTGKKLLKENVEPASNEEYKGIMKEISTELCKRAESILGSMKINSSQMIEISNQTLKSKAAMEAGSYYSAASYCFGNNVALRKILYQNWSGAKLLSKARQLKQDIERFESAIENAKLESMPQLQTYSIVTDRLSEAKDSLNEIDASSLAYAEERFFSARVWSKFFVMEGKEFVINQNVLRNSCTEKVQEARERLEYLRLFLIDGINIDDDIAEAEKQGLSGKYALCLIKASQAKAEANAILSTFGVDEKMFGDLVENKLGSLQLIITRTAEKGEFPILGYSYYEYANSLKDDDKPSALLYSEYGIELSNLDIYFEEEALEAKERSIKVPKEIAIAGIGFVIGFVLALILFRR